MKEIKDGRFIPLLIIIFAIEVVLAAGIAALMALFGWRITYMPELENSWNAISAVATWAGAIIGLAGVAASFLAVWSAIQVPKKIAEQQNKIALFEKRYQVYTSVSKIIQVAIPILNSYSSNMANAQKYFDNFSSSCRSFSMDVTVRDVSQERQRIIDLVIADLEKAPLLFEDISKENIKNIKKAIVSLEMILKGTASVQLNGAISEEEQKEIKAVLNNMEQQLYLG